MVPVTISDLFQLTGYTIRYIREKLEQLQPIKREHNRSIYDSTLALDWLYQPEDEHMRLSQERARLVHHQADLKLLELQRARGELIPVHDVEAVNARVITAARVKFLALHSKIRARHPEMPIEIGDDIEATVKEILADLAKGGDADTPPLSS